MSHVQRWELFGCGLKLRICDGPSWVPDLAAPWPQRIDPWTQFSSGCSRICATYAGAGVLNIAGVQCATVSGATAAVSGTGPDQVQLVRSWEPSDMETAIYVTGDSVSDAFARALLQDWTKDRFPQFSLTPLEDWKASGGNGLFGPAARPATWVSCEPFDRTDYTGNLAYCCCLGRSFITTAEGYIGLGPDGVEPGDIICVFLGCSRPVVLRPMPNDRYQLVGDAFVYGLHDALALLGPLPTLWRVHILSSPDRVDGLVCRFFNANTGEHTAEDPRLEPHPEWDRVELQDLGRKLTGDDPECCDFFRHKTTGEMINYDPRMLPEALEARGVQLRKFALV